MFRLQFNAIHGGGLFNQLQWKPELDLPRAFLQPWNIAYNEFYMYKSSQPGHPLVSRMLGRRRVKNRIVRRAKKPRNDGCKGSQCTTCLIFLATFSHLSNALYLQNISNDLASQSCCDRPRTGSVGTGFHASALLTQRTQMLRCVI